MTGMEDNAILVDAAPCAVGRNVLYVNGAKRADALLI